MRSIDKERKTQRRVYQYATGRGGVPLENESPAAFDGTDRDYQYATGRGGVTLGRGERENIRQSNFGKGPKGWKRSDETIKEDICEALFSSYDIDASDIEVEVSDSLVSLRGTVDSRRTKRLVEDLIDNISGVEDIQNSLTLRTEKKIRSENLNLS